MTPLGILIGLVGVALSAHAAQGFEATYDALGAGAFILRRCGHCTRR
jgi:hypothetical protein